MVAPFEQKMHRLSSSGTKVNNVVVVVVVVTGLSSTCNGVGAEVSQGGQYYAT
jgi:hypothetical protein